MELVRTTQSTVSRLWVKNNATCSSHDRAKGGILRAITSNQDLFGLNTCVTGSVCKPKAVKEISVHYNTKISDRTGPDIGYGRAAADHICGHPTEDNHYDSGFKLKVDIIRGRFNGDKLASMNQNPKQSVYLFNHRLKQYIKIRQG